MSDKPANAQCTDCRVDEPHEQRIFAGGVWCGGCGRKRPSAIYVLADAVEALQTRVAELGGEQRSCHELLDEFFEHPKDPNESVDRKLGRLIKDAMLVLKERDILIRGFRAAMKNQTGIKESLYPVGDWAAIREALSIVVHDRIEREACTEATQTVE